MFVFVAFLLEKARVQAASQNPEALGSLFRAMVVREYGSLESAWRQFANIHHSNYMSRHVNAPNHYTIKNTPGGRRE